MQKPRNICFTFFCFISLVFYTRCWSLVCAFVLFFPFFYSFIPTLWKMLQESTSPMSSFKSTFWIHFRSKMLVLLNYFLYILEKNKLFIFFYFSQAFLNLIKKDKIINQMRRKITWNPDEHSSTVVNWTENQNPNLQQIEERKCKAPNPPKFD